MNSHTQHAIADAIPVDVYDYRLPDHWVAHERDKDSLFARLHAAYVSRVVQIAKTQKVERILEVGCGDGWNCGEMVKAGLSVVGADWSRTGINYASLLVPGAEFYCGDVRDREFLSRFESAFDAVAMIEVIEHIPPDDCVQALKNIATPLKPNGFLIITTPSVNQPNDNPNHYRHFTAGLLSEIVTEAGFEVLWAEGYGNMAARRSYWRKARWLDNRYFRIKPAMERLTRTYSQNIQLQQTDLSLSEGIILVAQLR